MSRQALRGRTKINTWCQTNRPWSTRGGTSPEAKKGLLQAFARSSIDKFMISALFWCGCPHSPLQTFRAHPPANQQWVLQSLASRAIASWTLHQACSNLRSKGSIIERRNQSQPRLALPSILVCARTDETQQRHAKSASQNPEKWAIGGVVVSVKTSKMAPKRLARTEGNTNTSNCISSVIIFFCEWGKYKYRYSLSVH